jgi:hypothetical protein
MPSKRLFIGVLILVTILLSFIFMTGGCDSERRCSYSILLKSGNTIKAKGINLYNSGFYDIHTCEGERIVMSEASILKITDEE